MRESSLWAVSQLVLHYMTRAEGLRDTAAGLAPATARPLLKWAAICEETADRVLRAATRGSVN